MSATSRRETRRQRTRFWRKQAQNRNLPAVSKEPEVEENAEVFEKWNEFRQLGLFCDGEVVSADGKNYKIHRAILASNSDYFMATFGSPLSSNATVARLEFPSSVVDCIVEFCYKRTCSITEHNVEQLLPAADKIGIISLVKLCCKFLTERLTINNAYGIFRFASAYGCGSTLAQNAWNLILNRFASFLDKSSEFTEVAFDDLRLLLSDAHLNIPSETVAFRAIRDWINVDPAREEKANQLWECVRFGLIPPEYLRTEVLTVPFIESISSNNLWNALDSVKQGDQSSDSCTPRIPYQVLFAIGGWSEGAPTNCMESYDIRADRWFKSNLNDGAPRAYHGLVSVNNLVYMIGGFDGTNHFNSVRCFDPTTKKWTEKACMNKQRCYVSCVVVDKDIYAIGGFNNTTRMSSVERYSIPENQWSFVRPMNGRRSDCGAVVVGKKIYVAGGFNGQEVLNTAECYDVETETWHVLPNLNVRRSGVCLVWYRDCIYAIGGFNGGARLNCVERMSLFGPSIWQMDVPSMITQRSNFCSVVLEDKIYVVGGFNGLHTIRYCECFDGEKWYEISGMNQNRSALCVCVVEGLKNAADFTFAGLGKPKSRCEATQVNGAPE
uniref:Kelch-like protein diablo n=1 Tax=Lygus hesperus TaxID=30085 RepID=A0A0A9X721_LYGHE